MEQKAKARDGEITKLNSEITKLRDSLKVKDSMITKFIDRIREQRAEIASLRTINDELKLKYESRERYIDTLQVWIDEHIDSQLENIELRIDSHE